MAGNRARTLSGQAGQGIRQDAWDLLRGERGELPRAINIVSGPSRTADVEQTIQLGAHGPRRLHVLLLRDAFA